MNAERRRSQRDYTLAFKLAVVDQVEKLSDEEFEALDLEGRKVSQKHQ